MGLPNSSVNIYEVFLDNSLPNFGDTRQNHQPVAMD